MTTAYYEHRIAHVSSRKPRKTLRAPVRHIAIRKELIAASKTRLVLRPEGRPKSAVAYRITDEDGSPHFTVTGRKYSDRSCREFRDASGLPLFELHRRISFTNIWSVSLPGSNNGSIAMGTPRWSLSSPSAGNFNITFENAAAIQNKSEQEKKLTLQVERHGNALALFDIVDGDRKVAEVRESIQHNEKLALMRSSRQGYRPALDVIVTPGVDLSLIVIIAVIVEDWIFGSS
ncbi:hypothetical protein N7510_003749 [Penicillium lagena]|uniref:uncharacterized protein n=1 Tax=Penicillium lagena TaxID=94218 RepID=UPI0025413846|nr:uncharacterized protein N7510_003749 [Penicillium lagena]KAJ5619765.1 hypothetical protein N7510_003749 [Penicillium lagena]